MTIYAGNESLTLQVAIPGQAPARSGGSLTFFGGQSPKWCSFLGSIWRSYSRRQDFTWILSSLDHIDFYLIPKWFILIYIELSWFVLIYMSYWFIEIKCMLTVWILWFDSDHGHFVFNAPLDHGFEEHAAAPGDAHVATGRANPWKLGSNKHAGDTTWISWIADLKLWKSKIIVPTDYQPPIKSWETATT